MCPEWMVVRVKEEALGIPHGHSTAFGAHLHKLGSLSQSDSCYCVSYKCSGSMSILQSGKQQIMILKVDAGPQISQGIQHKRASSLSLMEWQQPCDLQIDYLQFRQKHGPTRKPRLKRGLSRKRLWSETGNHIPETSILEAKVKMLTRFLFICTQHKFYLEADFI